MDPIARFTVTFSHPIRGEKILNAFEEATKHFECEYKEVLIYNNGYLNVPKCLSKHPAKNVKLEEVIHKDSEYYNISIVNSTQDSHEVFAVAITNNTIIDFIIKFAEQMRKFIPEDKTTRRKEDFCGTEEC
ncbi:MAG: hypothetical protein GXP45_01825 [bacterium]|nr:hypothetical protein [bacterium]